MDRELDPTTKRKKSARRIAAFALPLFAVVGAIVLFAGLLRPSIDRDEIRTAKVRRGEIEASLQGSGVVVPESENVISTPVEARVMRILKPAGSPVLPGEEIVALDTSTSRVELEKVDENIAQKRTERAQLLSELEQTVAQIRGLIEQKRLDVELLSFKNRQSMTLRSEGLIPEDTSRQSDVAFRKSQIELAQLAKSIESSRVSTATSMATVDRDLSLLQKDRAELVRQLELATARADRSGVVTWVTPEVGATVGRGEVIARIADQKTFRVDGSISDVHASKLYVGMPVTVVVDEHRASGRIGTVLPRIENGVVKFTVHLDHRSETAFRNNLRVDLLLATGRRGNTLTIERGPFATEDTWQHLFVVRGDRAFKTKVRIGLQSSEALEVISGLQAGDEVIVSETKPFEHLAQIRIN